MILNNVTINNFGAIGQAKLNFNSKGLVAIEGENRDDDSTDSNGAGKTTIPQAIFWCLFGALKPGQKADAVVNHRAGKDCFVAIELFDEDDVYDIHRYRKHSEFKNELRVFKSGENVSCGRATQALIEKIIGCDQNVFEAAIYATQKGMLCIPEMTDRQIKDLLEKAANIDGLDGAAKVARSDFKTVGAEIDALDNELRIKDVKLQGLEIELVKEAGYRDNFEADQLKELFDLKAGMDDWNSKLKKLSYKQFNLKNNIDTSDFLEEEIHAFEDGSRRITDQINEKKVLLAVSDSKIRDLDKDIAEICDLILELGDEFEKIELPEKCDHCNRPYEHGSEAKYAVRNAKHDIFERKKRLNQQREDLTSELKYIESFVEKENEEIRSLKSIIEDNNLEIESLKREILARNEKKNEINSLPNYIAEAKTAIKTYEQDIEKEKSKENHHAKAVAALQAKKEEVEKEKEQIAAAIAAKQATCDTLLKVVDVYSPAGVRAHIIDNVTPVLNASTNEYLSALTDGNMSVEWSTLSKKADGELVEKFSILVSAPDDQTYFDLSGGEKRKVALACYLGLQDFVASRAEKNIDLFIADEIDNALDQSGLERLFLLLEEKTSQRGTGLVISHNDIISWVKSSAKVIKENGQAFVVGDLNV